MINENKKELDAKNNQIGANLDALDDKIENFASRLLKSVQADSDDLITKNTTFESIMKNNSKKSVRFANNDNNNDDDNGSNRKTWTKKNKNRKNKKKKSLLKRTGSLIVRSCRLMTYGAPHMPYNMPYNDCNGPYHYDFYRNYEYYDDGYGRYDNNQYMRYGEYGPGSIYF